MSYRRISPAVAAIMAFGALSADLLFQDSAPATCSLPSQTSEEAQRAVARAEAKRERRRKR